MIKRLVFGKRYLNDKNKDDKIDFLEGQSYLYFYLIVFLFIIICITLYFLLVIPNIEQHYDGYSNEQVIALTNITYEGLTKSERMELYSILREIKPIYFEETESITFTKNLSKYCDTCGGQNWRGDIVVGYSTNTPYLRRTICHELLHNFFISNKRSHIILSDVARYQVCYSRSQV